MKDHGLSDFNRTIRFTGSFNYQLPGQDGRGRYVLGGWQLNGIVILQTGGPLNFTAGADNSFSGIGADRIDIVGIPICPTAARGAMQIREILQHRRIQGQRPGYLRDGGPQYRHRDRLRQLDLSLFKSIPMPYAEGHKVEFRAEMFNSLNRVNLGNPTTNQLRPLRADYRGERPAHHPAGASVLLLTPTIAARAGGR